MEPSVLVEPKLLVQQSLTPANVRTVFGVSPPTNPRPLGPGMISIATLPHFPRILNGIECGWPHPHSQLPQPRRIGTTPSLALMVALSMALLTCFALPPPTPRNPVPFPTATIALKR